MLFSFAPMFRSLTRSPAATAIDQAHKMARRRIAAGGAAGPTRRPPDKTEPAAFLIPADVDHFIVARAVRQKLGMAEPVGESADALQPLERRKFGGRIVLDSQHLVRLGDGRFDVGRRAMHRIIGDVRARQRRLR